MIIIGSGLAGLLAGNLLSRRRPTIMEAQQTLPSNHSAILRFKTSTVGDALGIPFKKVELIKSIIPWHNPVADALMYSYKCNGQHRSDRSIIQGTVSATRFIAPNDLIPRMAEGLNIKYNQAVGLNGVLQAQRTNEPVISTIPMPTLMTLLGWENPPEFQHRSGVNVKATVKDCEAYVSLLVPDPAKAFARISLTGDELIAECYGNGQVNATAIAHDAAYLLGVKMDPLTVAIYPSKYAKILPIDERVRREFLFWATTQFNIFSLGRFATWRPGLLLDNLINDIRLIDQWSQSGHYDRGLKR